MAEKEDQVPQRPSIAGLPIRHRRAPADAHDTDLANVVGRGVRTLRNRRGLSQSELAVWMQRIGFGNWNRDTVAATEIGRRIPNLGEAIGLAIVLEATLPELLDGDERVILGVPVTEQGAPGVDVYHSLLTLRDVVRGSSDSVDVNDDETW